MMYKYKILIIVVILLLSTLACVNSANKPVSIADKYRNGAYEATCNNGKIYIVEYFIPPFMADGYWMILPQWKELPIPEEECIFKLLKEINYETE